MSGLCPNPWDFWDVFGLVFFFFNVILLWDIYRNKVKNERKIFEIAVLLFFSPKDVYTAHQAKFLLVHLIFDWASKNRRIFLGDFYICGILNILNFSTLDFLIHKDKRKGNLKFISDIFLPCFSIYPSHFFFLLTCFMGQIICWKVEKIKSFFVTLEFDKKMNLQSDCWFDCLVIVLYFSLRFSSFIHSSNTKKWLLTRKGWRDIFILSTSISHLVWLPIKIQMRCTFT